MSTHEAFLNFSIWFALLLLSIAFLGLVYRIIRGPTLPDRIVGLDTLLAVAIGFISTLVIKTGFALYIDIAITVGLVGFIATLAISRFMLSPQGRADAGKADQAQQAKGER